MKQLGPLDIRNGKELEELLEEHNAPSLVNIREGVLLSLVVNGLVWVLILCWSTGCTMTISVDYPTKTQGSSYGVEDSHQLEQLLTDQDRELEE